MTAIRPKILVVDDCVPPHPGAAAVSHSQAI